jgi:hypothetical protein
MKEILEYLAKEWIIIAGAPWAFLISVVLCSSIVYAALNWRYSGIIETLKERLETLKHSISAKDGQLDEYRERLHLSLAHGSKYSRLTHIELKEQALKIVAEIRNWLYKWELEDRKILDDRWLKMVNEKSESEKNRLWQGFTTQLSEKTLSLNNEYDHKFKVDTILLRDELLSRITSDSRNQSTFGLYEHPTNPIGIKMVSDDIERMSKLLL